MSEELFTVCKKAAHVIMSRSGNTDMDASDLATEIYLKIQGKVKLAGSELSLAFTVGKRVLIDRWRASQKGTLINGDMIFDIIDDRNLLEPIEADVLLEQLAKQLNSRELETYQVICLGLSNKESAAILGMDVNAYKARVHRFRKKWADWCIP